MGSRKISLDYGKYEWFEFGNQKTELELKWNLPEKLEKKHLETFETAVAKGIDDLEEKLESGMKQAKEWLKALNARIHYLKGRYDDWCITARELREVMDLQKIDLTELLKNLEQQRISIFEHQLERIVNKAIRDLVDEYKIKVEQNKVKCVLKILGMATLTVTATAVALFAAIVTFGAAAGPIIGLVGLAIGTTTATVAVVEKSKKIWAAGKDEAKELEASARNYAAAAKAFKEVLNRQTSMQNLKEKHLENLKSEYNECIANVDKLSQLAKPLPKGLRSILDRAQKAKKQVGEELAALYVEFYNQQQLLASAEAKQSFEAAIDYANSLRKSNAKVLDNISEHGKEIAEAVGSVGEALKGLH